MKQKLINIAYHRNGVSGTGFYAVTFTDENCGNMIASVFPEDGHVAVYCLDKLPEITFLKNSYRGDYFESFLRNEIKKYKNA